MKMGWTQRGTQPHFQLSSKTTPRMAAGLARQRMRHEDGGLLAMHTGIDCVPARHERNELIEPLLDRDEPSHWPHRYDAMHRDRWTRERGEAKLALTRLPECAACASEQVSCRFLQAPRQ